VAPFRLNRDELEHDLPWRLMQNGPVTLYWRREYFDEDIGALRERGFVVPSFDCRSGPTNSPATRRYESGSGCPTTPGTTSTPSVIRSPRSRSVALDNVTDAPRADVLLDVLASASRWWLLFGRIFGVLARTDNPDYEPPAVGATRPDRNGREWLAAKRSS
jgi:hypothetical protein